MGTLSVRCTLPDFCPKNQGRAHVLLHSWENFERLTRSGMIKVNATDTALR